MLNKENFKPKFGTWYNKIEPLFDNGVMDDIYKVIKEQSKKGIKITPDSDNVFRCFRETPIDKVKVVMMGFCPYHSVVQNKLVADGLLMGCSNHANYIAPSLDQYYGAIEEEFKDGLCLPCVRTGDVSFLAHQGVLMFNSSLTTIVGTAGAHQELWKPFTAHMMKVFKYLHLPVIFLGNDAAEFSNESNLHFKLTHPASASRRKIQWNSEGVFKKVNSLLDDWNQKPIQWIMEDPPF